MIGRHWDCKGSRPDLLPPQKTGPQLVCEPTFCLHSESKGLLSAVDEADHRTPSISSGKVPLPGFVRVDDTQMGGDTGTGWRVPDWRLSLRFEVAL